jgi:hypothetical protein
LKNPRMQAWLTRPGGLAALLRAARGSQSVRQLADAIGWQPSKVSRIETGNQVPTEGDIDQWAAATDATSKQRKQWQNELAEAMSMRSTFQRRQDRSQVDPRAEYNDLESVSTFVRSVQLDTIPPLLQTQEYARAVFSQAHGATADSVDKAVAALMRRQVHLHDPAKRFEFVIGEAALRYIPVRAEVMAAQFDRLISASDLRNVRLGVVPQMRPLAEALPPAPFVIYDDNDAVSEDALEGHQYKGGQVRSLHDRVDAMWLQAVEGEEARMIIVEVKRYMPTD